MMFFNCLTDRYYHLDDVGTRMWQLLAESGETESVVSQLLAEYDIEEETLRQDLAALITKLSDAGLITCK